MGGALDVNGGSVVTKEGFKEININGYFPRFNSQSLYNVPNVLGDPHGVPGVDGAVHKHHVGHLDVSGSVNVVGPPDSSLQQIGVVFWAVDIAANLLLEPDGEVHGVGVAGHVGSLIPKREI